MIKQTNAQVNLPNQATSLIFENTSKKPSFSVSYRTQTQIDHIESLRYPLFQHPNTKRKSSAAALLRQIIWRHINLPNQCVTGQHTLGRKLRVYHYDKNVGDRQIRRILKLLLKAGLIKYFNPTGEHLEIYKAEPTELGMDVYHYIIKNNRTNVRYKIMERTPKNPIDTTVLEEIPQKKDHHIHDQYLEKDQNHTLSDFAQHTKPVARKINLNGPVLSYDELQNEHLHVNVGPYPEKIEPKASDCLPQAPDEPGMHWSEKIPQSLRPGTVPQNKTKLPYEVFQMLDKNFIGEQFDILCEMVLNQEVCIAYKISMIECVKKAVTYYREKGKKIINFPGLAYNSIEKYLERIQHTYLPTENVDNLNSVL